ncbi:MAG: ATP-binding protein [Bacteroidaceae bacterium]|nr:ATP-binding protein [Bacteroidaceae bacterium]
MRRKIYHKLMEWKAGNGESALLIDGARRVGKSYIAEEFAKKEYKTYILIDFNQVDKNIKELFDRYLSDLDTLFLTLSNYYGVTLHTRNTLFIFDEVQECPKARAAIKYLVADGRYDYLETGSLISINNNVKDIIIPSEEEHIRMYPMDFEEFLWATGNETLMDLIRTFFTKEQPLGQALHRKVMDLFRQYVIVGGMPQAVEKWITSKDFDQVDAVKRRILALYRADFAKHTRNLREKVEKIFDTIPSQLSKHEKRFKLSALGQNARMRSHEDAFVWLDDSMIVNLCFNSTDPNVGLSLNEDRSMMKCYMGDTGLLISMAFDDHGQTDSEIYKKLLLDKLEVNKGMIIENIVAQMLRVNGHKLFFYSNPSPKEKEDRMEIDFLITKHAITNRHNISPIEVKSGSQYSLTSLNKFENKFEKRLSTPYVIHTKDLEKRDELIYLPIYMTCLL